MKIISIVGNRPQFIKVAALHREAAKEKKLQHIILHTGQHYDYNLSAIFFNELEIPKPHFHIQRNNPDSASSIDKIKNGTEEILKKERPEVVLVYGDTNTTIAGALAAKKLNIKIAHVEAGLRSYDNFMPEEFNRIETDKISDLLFCPTKFAVETLIREGFEKNKIVFSGDVMLDSMNHFKKRIDVETTKNIIPENDYIICTLHRHGLVESHIKLTEVINALNKINEQTTVLLPAHPRLKKAIDDLQMEIKFKIIEPVGYLNMIRLLKNCSCVITDSGGLQKVAYFSKKMCVTVRENTEWKELVEAGVNFIAADSSSEKIITAYNKAINTKGNFERKFYGDGNAAKIIISSIMQLPVGN